MEIENAIPDDPLEKINRIQERLEDARKKMEIEAHIFIEATKHFTSEWIQREMEVTILSSNASSPDNSKHDSENSEKLSKLKSDLKKLPLRIPDIVEVHLNCDNYWIHRNSLPQADTSRDYLDFKKEKMRKELTSKIRMILGCASEIFGDLKEEESENKIWVKERGKRKYVCFLRFSDEMTASLNRYFERLEEFLALNHEMKEEIERIDGKKI